MIKYVVKNQNKNVFGMTDYDILMFGFKSALKNCAESPLLWVWDDTHTI